MDNNPSIIGNKDKNNKKINIESLTYARYTELFYIYLIYRYYNLLILSFLTIKTSTVLFKVSPIVFFFHSWWTWGTKQLRSLY